jgi:hypothetical protein
MLALVGILASASTALATVLTAIAPVRVPDNPLANSSSACIQLIQQQ